MPNEDPEIIRFDNVVVFEKPAFRPNECKHDKVTFSVKLSTIECRDCHEKLNPIIWLSDYFKEIERWKNRVLRKAATAQAIQDKLNKTGDFLCTKYHHMNKIDLRKLVSNAAVARKMKVLEDALKQEGE